MVYDINENTEFNLWIPDQLVKIQCSVQCSDSKQLRWNYKAPLWEHRMSFSKLSLKKNRVWRKFKKRTYLVFVSLLDLSCLLTLFCVTLGPTLPSSEKDFSFGRWGIVLIKAPNNSGEVIFLSNITGIPAELTGSESQWKLTNWLAIFTTTWLDHCSSPLNNRG